MKKVKFLLLLALALDPFTIRFYAQDTDASDHVILVSIDGFRPDFYLEDKWPAPNLKKMANEGVKVVGRSRDFSIGHLPFPYHVDHRCFARPSRYLLQQPI